MFLAREGWLPSAGMLVAASAVSWKLGTLVSVPAWALFFFLLFVFRDPVRQVPALPLAVVSPADGCVEAVEEARDPWLDRAAIRVAIRLPFPGICVLRSPTEGKIMDFWATAGAERAPSAAGVLGNNLHCYALWVRTDEGEDVVCAVSTSRAFSRLRLDVSPGNRIGQGKRNGFVFFGRRVEVFVPGNSMRAATVGQYVLAGSGVVATLVHA